MTSSALSLPAPEALLWDNDGVLVDTEGLYFRATREVLTTVGVELDEALYLELFLRAGQGAWHLARERGSSDHAISELKAARNVRYLELLGAGGLVYEGVRESLRALAARYRMAIVTTSERQHFDMIHRTSELLPHFELTLTRGDYTHSKPHPEPYLLALSRIGLPAERCLVIEDSERGLQAAVAAGLRCWIIPSHFTRGSAFTGAERIFPDIAALTRALLQKPCESASSAQGQASTAEAPA